MTSDVPLPSAPAGGRETTALVTPDNHLWSLTVWPLPPSNSKYLLDIISPCRRGGWGGEEVGRQHLRREKLRPEGTNIPTYPAPRRGWKGDNFVMIRGGIEARRQEELPGGEL